MKKMPKTLFEKSRPGKVAFSFKSSSLEAIQPIIDNELLRFESAELPELSEVEVVRHYTALSHLNYSVDEGFYPLGSCTMKYNPKINEKIASMEELQAHPLLEERFVQGNLELIYLLEEYLGDITGMAGITTLPAAGAHGEFTGMLMVRAYFNQCGEKRRVVLIPDSAHGTNPASAHFAGYEVKEIASSKEGTVDLDVLRQELNAEVAALMVTNPNTLGIFESKIMEIADLLHQNGSLLYMDGANLNALIGKIKPGNFGVDVLHLNLHKTFSTPHGAGGPGAGPVGVSEKLVPFLPLPRIVKCGDSFKVIQQAESSIGRVKNFYGQFLVLIKALAYILSLGRENLPRVAEDAVLNANYIRKKLEDLLDLPYKNDTLHEVVFSDRGLPVKTLDIAKRLLDYGMHPFTIYFPLIVHGAMMIEPTETESLETLDEFIAAMKKIIEEAKTNPDLLQHAPHNAPVRRLNETLAARNLILRWKKEQ